MSGKRISDKDVAVTIETLLVTLKYLKGLDLRREGNFSQGTLQQMAVADIVAEQLAANYKNFIAKSKGSIPAAYTQITIPRQLVDDLQNFFKAYSESFPRKKK
ncbi:MAG: hypothetical protein WC823_00320 [Parcubacteria group bacterium]|jgi:hypothetical protein